MTEFLANLAHFTHGMTLMFFVMMALHTYSLRKKNRLMTILFWVMIFWVFIELKDLTYLIDHVWIHPYVSKVHLSIDMWCVPVIIILLFEVVSPKWATLRRIIFVFLPTLILTFLYVFLADEIIYRILVIYSNVIGFIALLTVLLTTSRYDQFIKRNFSYVDNLTLEWIRFLIVALYVLLLIWTVINTASTWLGDVVFYLLQIALWFSFYHYASRHDIVHTPQLSALLFENKEANSAPCEACATSEGKEKFLSDLQRVMEGEKIYLNPELNVSMLAATIGTNRTYLSNCLNNLLRISFYEYVNSYRVKEACELLKNSEQKTLDDIADLCGFNSLSTFRRAFMKNMNQTPNQYRNTHRSAR